MSKTFRPYDPDQQLLLPAALQEWLPPDHLAYFISDVAPWTNWTSSTLYLMAAMSLPHRKIIPKYGCLLIFL